MVSSSLGMSGSYKTFFFHLTFDEILMIFTCNYIQISGVLFTLAGFICGVMSVPFDHFKFAHGAIGLLVFLIGLLQICNGLL